GKTKGVGHGRSVPNNRFWSRHASRSDFAIRIDYRSAACCLSYVTLTALTNDRSQAAYDYRDAGADRQQDPNIAEVNRADRYIWWTQISRAKKCISAHRFDRWRIWAAYDH